jgi:hypothetical protein
MSHRHIPPNPDGSPPGDFDDGSLLNRSSYVGMGDIPLPIGLRIIVGAVAVVIAAAIIVYGARHGIALPSG